MLAVTFPPTFDASTVGGFHSFWGWVAVGLLLAIALWGLGLALRRRAPGRAFWTGTGVAIAATVLQVGLGLYAFGVDGIAAGNQHLFYGILLLFTFAFAYIYRPQLAKRPALSYGLLLLFAMGLGVRAVLTFGLDF